jgi:hypothetical protein
MYYPKSRIQENLYSSGGEFIYLNTGQPFQGFYHKTYDGRFFEGKTHDFNSSELKSVSTAITSAQTQPVNLGSMIYDKASSGAYTYLKTMKTPASYYPSPDENDYKRGYIIRYFIKKANGAASTIQEVSSETAREAVKNPLYISTNLEWKISGPISDDNSDPMNPVKGVKDTNQRILIKKEREFSGISRYLTNLLEFYQ